MRNRLPKLTTKLISVLIAATLGATASFAAKAEDSAGPLLGGKLVVNIDDIHGLFDLDAEWIREGLLETAFYDAAKRKKWLGEYEFMYNDPLPKNPKNRLEVRLLDWSRNVANFFEFSASAVYYDADGNANNLGMIYGTRSGIDVTLRYDIGENFAETAEDAFAEALRKLRKVAS